MTEETTVKSVPRPFRAPPSSIYVQQQRRALGARAAPRAFKARAGTDPLVVQAAALSGPARPLCMALVEVEASRGLTRFFRPLIVFTFLLLVALLGLVAVAVVWTPAYRLYWSDVLRADRNITAWRANQTHGDGGGAWQDLLERPSDFAQMAPLPSGCQEFETNSERLTSGVEAILDVALRTPFQVDALPNEPQSLGPGLRLELDSLVVDEVHHGRWNFGLCWHSPWWQTMPDQLVLRLRRIGLTATLNMRVIQHVPFHGDVVITSGSATVEGLGVVALDKIDLEHLATPVRSCEGDFLLTMQGAHFDVGGYSAGVGAILDGIDVGKVFPVQDVLCFGEGATSLSELNRLQANASSTNGTAPGAAGMVNEMVWEYMPFVHLATTAVLCGAVLLVTASLLALLGTVMAVAAYVDDSPRALCRVALVASALCGLVLRIGWSNPAAGPAACLLLLALLLAWRLLASAASHVRAAAASPRRAAVLAGRAGAALTVGYLLWENAGTTGARPLLLLYGLTATAAIASLVIAPFCTATTAWGVGEVGLAATKVGPPSATRSPVRSSTSDKFAARLRLFEALNLRLHGLPRCYVYLLAALLLAGFVVVFFSLDFSRELNRRTQYSEAPVTSRL